MVSKIKTETQKTNFIEKNKEVFEGVGKMKDKCVITSRDDAIRKARPAHRVSNSILKPLQEDLCNLEKKQSHLN